MAQDGRWVLYGLLSGAVIDNFDLRRLFAKRGNLICTTLRSRSNEFKGEIIKEMMEFLAEDFSNGKINPYIDQVVKLRFDEEGEIKIRQAHDDMAKNKNSGKIVLEFIE